MKNINIALFLLCCVSGLMAQQSPLLTKKDAVAETLERNFGIVIARNNVAISENNKSVLNSGFLPSLTGNAGANYNIEDQTVTFQDGSESTVQDAETTRYNASVNLAYTLFDGMGRYYDYKRLKEEYNLGELQARETIELTMLQLFTVYFEVARLSENVTVLDETFQNTKNRLTRAQYAFEYGQVNKLEVLNAEVDIVTDSINLMNAKQQLENAKRDLNVVTNEENLERQFSVDTTVAFSNPLQLEAFIRAADTNNVRLLQANRNIKISEYDYKASKSIYLPSVGLAGAYGWNEGNFPATNFSSSSTTTGFSAGVTLRWSLFDGGSGITAVKNARIRTSNEELFKMQIISEVKRDIANARGDYENRLAIYRLQEKNVLTATNNFERSNERYKLGQITSLELRQAQINLLNARTNKNLAKYEAKLAELELLQLTGQLLNTEL
ncbi:outer membrane protein TolC [Ulvibacter sp. MAR_2010_11]|uniref:TolC family protein n=1 Tax=Ulvibacter sp. MAR_2010_11 TaxID=1250229 RepID=UPI000C2B79A4|nr:TolC family protein [Ulvibacter sp. MAR_2010_11]PKA82461.1 outer membrane protein TolC [Ulvibacter sp. MAR_2010_11]